MIAAILNAVAALLALFVVGVFVVNWVRDRRRADWAGLPWFQKALYVSRDSLVWLVGFFQIIASAIIANIDGLANALGQPQLVVILDKYFPAKYVGYVLLASALWFMWARGRTLEKPTIAPSDSSTDPPPRFFKEPTG